TVEEGQSYRYRVALLLENPNYTLTTAVLKNIALGKGEYRQSPFSEPSASVRISTPTSEVVAGTVRSGRAEVGQADSATVILRQRHRVNGSIVAHTFKGIEGGQMLNFKATNVKYEKIVGGVAATSLPEFSFTSDELLLDLKGGGDRGWPGELLLLDP